MIIKILSQMCRDANFDTFARYHAVAVAIAAAVAVAMSDCDAAF